MERLMRSVVCQLDEQISESLLVPEHKSDHSPKNRTVILDKYKIYRWNYGMCEIWGFVSSEGTYLGPLNCVHVNQIVYSEVTTEPILTSSLIPIGHAHACPLGRGARRQRWEHPPFIAWHMEGTAWRPRWKTRTSINPGMPDLFPHTLHFMYQIH